ADISNIGQTSIHATNNEITAITSNQNSPKETSSRFFSYGIIADESTRVTDITHCNAETISTTVYEMCKQKGIDLQM
ncbi:19707_t:CDS:2, partial [Racocetra persica]